MNDIEQESYEILTQWLVSCTRGKNVARNTYAMGIVVLDHLRRKCPVSWDDVISPGGEVKGARSGLGNVLEKYGVPKNYLKEATSRQSPQDGQRLFEAFEWGNKFQLLSNEERDNLLLGLISKLANGAHEWLGRQNLKLDIDRRQSPLAWIGQIVENAKGRSGGVVEQHLVGAKLEKRFDSISVPNHPAHAGDKQTARSGDFSIAQLVYHVTATPGRGVIMKCGENLKAGEMPILLVPKSQIYKAVALAEEEGIDKQVKHYFHFTTVHF
ncbi:MAG: DUF4928 family protein [Chloroflexi bacterium]|nr:DUF4928 family protein [Ardenticatenaceae bacterium]MBL1131475.1 DUF4928 domain-containing protein [Chloroflexota bacterium]NOG37586.1 DUF4928 family protein [Chloroflexota bacterium]